MPTRPAALAAVLIGAGCAYRIYLVAVGLPPSHSDEATMALAALHISTGRHFPVFFYGQAYMGALEAYLAAPLFWLFGPSTTALRVPLLLMYAGFAVGAYLLARRLYPPWLATVTAAALALGSDQVIRNQLVAAGGYPEISPLAVWLLLLSVWLGAGRVRLRALAFAGWGLLVGLLIWDDWLILPYVGAAAAVLLVGCWPALRSRRGPLLALATAVGVVLGAAPLLIHNITRPWTENSISAYLYLNSVGPESTLREHLHGGVLFGIPMGTGLCPAAGCASWQMSWGVVYLVLLVAAMLLALRGLRRAATPEVRLIEVTRFALLAAAAVTVALYTRSPSASTFPVDSAHYLAALPISLPAVLWPLWTSAARLRARLARPDLAPASRRWSRVGTASAAVALAGFLASMLVATAGGVAALPLHGPQGDRYRVLADALVRRGHHRIYSDYWTCNLITFATRERVVCAVITPDLRPGADRYPPYRDQVLAADAPAYVAPVELDLDARLAGWLAVHGVPHVTATVAGYHIYQPATRVPLPIR